MSNSAKLAKMLSERKRRAANNQKLELILPGPSGEAADQTNPARVNKTPRAARTKKNKTSVVFDPEKRRQWLTGFRKRKDERRKKAREKAERGAKEEVRRAREEARGAAKRAREAAEASSSHRVVPEIEHLLERRQEVAGVQTDFGSHVVTVTHVPDLTRTMEEDVDEDGGKVESGAAPTTAPVSSKKAVRAANRELTRKINSNKLVQRAQKIKSKSSKNKSRVLKGKKTQKTKRNRHHHPNKRST